jgi:predicted transcriptional regulator
MKTAVSVPDDLFRMAEAAARRLRVSRSQLYATAISEFLNRQQGSAVTERLNEVYSRRPATVYRALHRAQRKSLEKDSG